ncbi:hypothetical protein ABF70_04075 [Enterobacter hormaechei subsp. steigerwaltii]|nr:hypothetical protein ABF70_04075 [Enterobacter hormaechei subsp. steigerwaltii]
MAYLLNSCAIELPATAGGVIEKRNATRRLGADFGSENQIPAGECSAGFIFRVSIKAEHYRCAFWGVVWGCKE